ncbi:9414_t:CDS:2 [Rhizophagus irregularis]|nr:9414_t:CDS:2 [Rhizophagus irregularis]
MVYTAVFGDELFFNELKDEDINVNHETKSSGSILLTDDAVLVEIIWAEFFDLFKLGGDSWEQLPTYEGSTMNFSDYKKTIDVIVESLLMVQKTSPNNRKNNHDSPSVLYGIDNNDRPIEVFKSSLTPIILPLSEPGLNKATLTPRVEELFGQLLWIFNEQLNSRGTLKRSHT